MRTSNPMLLAEIDMLESITKKEASDLAVVNEMEVLKADKAELLEALTDISNMCIGEISMGYKLDAQSIGESIYKATGLTNPELNNLLQKHKG